MYDNTLGSLWILDLKLQKMLKGLAKIGFKSFLAKTTLLLLSRIDLAQTNDLDGELESRPGSWRGRGDDSRISEVDRRSQCNWRGPDLRSNL